MTNFLIVGAGGFVGAGLRYLMGLLPFSEGSFPLHTFLINLIGCFAMGCFTALILKYELPPQFHLFLRTGICGGFSTLSALALEVNNLNSDGKFGVSLLYIVATFTLCILATFLGEYCMK